MKHVNSLLRASETTLSVVCVAGFIVMFVLGVAVVFFRFVAERSLTFPDELIRYLFIWLVMLGAALAFRRGIHAAISMLTGALPAAMERAALICATLASIVFFMVLVWNGILLTRMVVPQISPAMEVSMAWVYAAVPVGGGFLLIYAIELLVKLIVLPVESAMKERHEK